MGQPCPHVNLECEVLDQTLGVFCKDCAESLGHCWMDSHIAESVWNRLASQDSDCVPCELSRDDYCAICKEQFTVDKLED